MATPDLKIGDRIKVRVATRNGVERGTRTVNGFTPLGNPTVRLAGHGEFIIRTAEIQEVNGEAVEHG